MTITDGAHDVPENFKSAGRMLQPFCKNDIGCLRNAFAAALLSLFVKGDVAKDVVVQLIDDITVAYQQVRASAFFLAVFIVVFIIYPFVC